MIIERKYVKLGQLFHDPKTKKVLDEAWTVFDGEDDERSNFLYEQRIIDKAMELAIPNAAKFFSIIENGFEELDRTCPYDNGFDYSNINKIEINYKDENGIELFLCNTFEGEDNIVKVVKIEG